LGLHAGEIDRHMDMAIMNKGMVQHMDYSHLYFPILISVNTKAPAVMLRGLMPAI
jgi:hypothetical protein